MNDMDMGLTDRISGIGVDRNKLLNLQKKEVDTFVPCRGILGLIQNRLWVVARSERIG